MVNHHTATKVRGKDAKAETSTKKLPAGGKKQRPLSMHEDVPVWHDCCSCEAEPYWVEAAEELGIDLSNCEDGTAQDH